MPPARPPRSLTRAAALFLLATLVAALAERAAAASTAPTGWVRPPLTTSGTTDGSRRRGQQQHRRGRSAVAMAETRPGGPPEVLCYGEALVDRLGPLGGDPAKDLPVDDRLGGAPANVACGLARLGTPVSFLGRLGEDGIGKSFRALFQERGVNTQALQWDQSRPSRIVLVKRDASGDREFGGFAGDKGDGFADQAVDAMVLTSSLIPLLTDAKWLLVGTLPLASAFSAVALTRAVEQARYSDCAIAVDINWRPTFWEGHAHPAEPPSPSAVARIRPILEQAALIKFAKEEAEWLFSGQADPKAISDALPQKPAVIVTDGGSELRWAIGAVQGRRPAFQVEAVDTTGAGDAFVAGLLHKLCQNPALLSPTASQAKEIEAIMEFACGCGALVCQGAGAIDPQPTAAEVTAFLQARQQQAANA